MKLKDQRMKIMQEILNGIKVVKLYAWEKKMMNMVRRKNISSPQKFPFSNKTQIKICKKTIFRSTTSERRN